MDLKDTVICIGAFLFGPLSAAVISIVVAVVEMFTVSDTGPIGCIMNVLATCAFCCTAAFVYKKFHTRKGAVIGLALGTVCLTVVMLCCGTISSRPSTWEWIARKSWSPYPSLRLPV